jgi:hypothetical protein
MNLDVILKRFDNPDETRIFEKGRFDLVTIGGMTIGRASYEPGWKWSEHVGKATGAAHCTVEHVGLVVSGCATAAMADGKITEMRAGDLFYIPSDPHDSWVVGDEPYVSLHFMGAGAYAANKA